MILNVKIFDDFMIINIDGINKDTINFIVNTILEGLEIDVDKYSILCRNNKIFYNILMLLNEHYSLVII